MVPFVCVMLLIVPTMGCLDVQLWKRFIEGEQKEKVGYEDVPGPSFFWKYNFDSQSVFDAILEGDPTSLTDIEHSINFRVKEGTTRLVISYNLTMINPSESGWEAIQEILNRTGGGENDIFAFLLLLKDLDRHLEIWLTDQNNNIKFYARHNETIDGTEQFFIMQEDLTPGTWTMKIESRGIGFEDEASGVQFHDEYSVTTLLRQPMYR